MQGHRLAEVDYALTPVLKGASRLGFCRVRGYGCVAAARLLPTSDKWLSALREERPALLPSVQIDGLWSTPPGALTKASRRVCQNLRGFGAVEQRTPVMEHLLTGVRVGCCGVCRGARVSVSGRRRVGALCSPFVDGGVQESALPRGQACPCSERSAVLWCGCVVVAVQLASRVSCSAAREPGGQV